MDLLSRLIAGSAATSPTKQKLNTPAERLNACKRLCNSLHKTWQDGTKLTNDRNASGHVAAILTRLNTILHDESRKAVPHSCLLHITSAQAYIITAKLAALTDDPEVINAARRFFHLLIDGEAEGILDSKHFARALIDFVRRSTSTANIVVDEQGEADLIELLFEITTKIKLDPDILPAWFYPERDQSRSRGQGSESRRSQFPLFYALVGYVHHDGPMGDFARTGLLYLTDLASRSKLLEQWMIESDLAPQMASGLSALYSRLSRQTHHLTGDEKAIPIIALSDLSVLEGRIDDSPEEFQHSVNAFLSYLAFWQDTLNHCKSDEVKDTLLDHFQVLFVQQLLYPSLLESSDVAGGSTSAVILHLYRMLDALDHHEMARRMLRYLLASDKQNFSSSQPGHKRGRMSISRRKSMEKLATLAEIANSPSPDLFNLLDLLTISLHSKHPQTVNASLKLITVILRRHHQHVLVHFFRTQPLSDVESTQSLFKFNQTMDELFMLSSNIARVDTADESYQAALSDGQLLLHHHSCMLCKEQMIDKQDYPAHRVLIAVDCKLFEAILDLLRTFFANDTITNITLTETIMALASCEHISLYHWISAGADPAPDKIHLTLIGIFKELVDQLRQWQTSFADWNALFTYQKARLTAFDDGPVERNVRSMSLVSHGSDVPRTGSPQPKQRPSTPIRTSTTRGRKIPPPGFASIDGTLAKSPVLAAISPKINAVANSPLHQISFPGDHLETGSTTTASTTLSNASLTQLSQQVRLPNLSEDEAVAPTIPVMTGQLKLDGNSTHMPRLTGLGSGTVTPSAQSEDMPRTSATLNHVMTNAVILQEFILEVAAMLQIRATLLDEVDVT